MSRFFFDVHDGALILDSEGTDMPDLDAAIAEAIACLPKIAAGHIPQGDDRRHFAIVVKDETGSPVYTAALSFCGTRL